MEIEESIGVEASSSPFVIVGGVTWQSMTAGYMAGCCGVAVGHPLDSIKVWIQMQIKSHPPYHGKTSAAATATATPISFYTWRNLYAGVQGPLLTVGLVQALNFGVYDVCRRYLYHHHQQQQQPTETRVHYGNHHHDKDYMVHGSLWQVALASSIAGTVISVPTSVLQATKIHQQVHHVWSLRVAACALYQGAGGGSRAFFTGMVPHLFCEAIGRMLYFTSYESLKRNIVQAKTNSNQNENEDSYGQLSLQERMICAGFSGVLCWAFIFPADVLRCRLYANSNATNINTWTMAQELYRKQGARVFYRGLGITLLRAAPVSAAVLPIYDVAHAWLSATST